MAAVTGKRVRLNDLSDTEYEVVESASSNLRATNKRQRTASVLSAEGLPFASRATSTSIDDAELPSTQFQRHDGHLEQHQRTRDDISVVSEDTEEALLEAATQSIARRRGIPGNIVPAENGILERVVLTNFMCHTKLVVTLGPLINFIIGHNGSGKSAVLTAITICLGGKATSTNRGQALKAFIKEGQEQATLEVRIKNQGTGAYKPELYGNSIIVERHFSLHGTSGFKMKNEQGRIISTKRSELDDITDFYALQLDNPVNVLTQDMARQFLNSSTPADKYKFFIKGVQLEQLDTDYVLLGDSLDGTEQELEKAKDMCKVKRDKRDAAVAKVKLSERYHSIREKVASYRRMLAWAQIEGTEKEIAGKENDVAQAERKVAKCEQEFADKSQRYDDACQAHDEAQQQVDQINGEQSALKQEYDDAQSRFEEVKKHIIELNHQQRSVNDEFRVHQRRFDQAQADLDKEHQRLQEVGGDNEAAKTAEVHEAEAKREEARRALDEHSGKIQQLQEEARNADAAYNEAERRRYAKEQEAGSAKSRLQELSNANRRDEWRGFMPNMKTLVDAINRESRFQTKPVGPFGRHVRLLRPDWSPILESYIGNSLNAFAVTSKADQNLLSDIMKRCRCTVPTYISSPTPLERIRQPEGFKTILQALEIDNELVKKHLIINQVVDQTVMLETAEEALDIMRNSNRFPEAMKSILTKHPRKMGFGMRWQFSGSGSQTSSPIARWQRDSRMAMDDREAIAAQNQTISALQRELFEAEQSKLEKQRGKTKASQAIQRHRQDTTNLRADEQRIDEELAELKAQLEELRPGDGQLDALKESLEEERGQVEHYSNQMDEVKRSKEEVALSNQVNKRDMDEAEAKVQAKGEDLQAAEETVTKYVKGKQHTLRVKNEYEERVKDAEGAKCECEREVVELQEQLRDWIPEAEKISARVPIPDGETWESLNTKHKKFLAELNRGNGEVGGTHDELRRQARACGAELITAETQFKRTDEARQVLAQSLEQRRIRWKKFRQAISIRARSSFGQLLAERRFTGKMIIDHASKLLDLAIEPDAARAAATGEGGNGSTGRQTKSLSGGEKSFSTICMLLALWEAMGSPIRCLDEFDVFMDNVNRDMSMKMLIDAAVGSVGRQYIFITPQAMGDNATKPGVTVTKLRDPERGQLTLTQTA